MKYSGTSVSWHPEGLSGKCQLGEVHNSGKLFLTTISLLRSVTLAYLPQIIHFIHFIESFYMYFIRSIHISVCQQAYVRCPRYMQTIKFRGNYIIQLQGANSGRLLNRLGTLFKVPSARIERCQLREVECNRNILKSIRDYHRPANLERVPSPGETNLGRFHCILTFQKNRN